MTNNFWNNIARSTVRELGKAAGLRASNDEAVLDLTEKYGPLPTAEFVDQMWPVLRDGWLTRSAPHRKAVVERMRELGMGNQSLRTRTRSEQLAYLRSLRRSPALADAVLQVFLESGSEERQPPVFVDIPADAVEQEARYLVAVREHLLSIDETTIEGYERAVHAAVYDIIAGLSFPITDPPEVASSIVATFAGVVLLEARPEHSRTPLQPYQRVILDTLAERVPDMDAVRKLLGIMTAALVPSLENPNATRGIVSIFGPAVLMATLAFDGPEAPEGFIEGIMGAQGRFRGEPESAVGVVAPPESRQGFDDALSDVMSRVPNTSRRAVMADGALAWNVFMGSAVVRVFRVPAAGNGPASVKFASPLVSQVQLTADLSATLNLINHSEGFYKFYWQDGAVWMEYSFIVDQFHEGSFVWSLRRFAGLADHYDTTFRGRFGGVTVNDDRRAVFDA